MKHDSSGASPYADTEHVLLDFVEQPVDTVAGPEARELRERVVGAIEVRQRGLATRRVALRRGLWAAAMAAAAAVPVAVWSGIAGHQDAAKAVALQASVIAVAGNSQLVGLGGIHPIDASKTPMGPDDELETGPQGAARASLPTGAVVDIGPSSHLRYLQMGDAREMHDRIELASGKIDVRVPKLASGSEVRVVTQGVTVVVHGTRFSVEQVAADATGHARTRVAVTEGRVAVYAGGKEQFLTAGAVWIDADAATPPSEPPPSIGPREASSLAVENGLLSEAMTLRRTHQTERSVALLDELIAKYPGSPLGETACVERLRALADLGATARLAREAEGYLARYPDGFARREARQLLFKAKGKR